MGKGWLASCRGQGRHLQGRADHEHACVDCLEAGRGRGTGTRARLDAWDSLVSRSIGQTVRVLHTMERGVRGGWRAAHWAGGSFKVGARLGLGKEELILFSFAIYFFYLGISAYECICSF